jgi:hypothetical protein
MISPRLAEDPCQRFARNGATHRLTPPTSRSSTASVTCAIVWSHEVVCGEVNPPHGMQGVTASYLLNSTTPSRVRCAPCVPAASTGVTGWQRSCRSAGQRIFERLLPLKAVAPVRIRSGLPTSTSTLRPLTRRNKGQRPCCACDQVRRLAPGIPTGADSTPLGPPRRPHPLHLQRVGEPLREAHQPVLRGLHHLRALRRQHPRVVGRRYRRQIERTHAAELPDRRRSGGRRFAGRAPAARNVGGN